MVPDRDQVGRVARYRGGQSVGEQVGNLGAEIGEVVGAQEQLQARAPVVIGGADGVESENFGARTDQRRSMSQPWEMAGQQRADGFPVETAGQFQTWDERW